MDLDIDDVCQVEGRWEDGSHSCILVDSCASLFKINLDWL
jgi:hypothetical protein